MDIVEAFQGDEDQRRDKIGAVVHGDVRFVLQGGDDVLVIGVIVLATDGEHGDAEVVDEAGERLLLLEALADAGQYGHVTIGPENALLARRSEAGVLDVTRLLGGCGHDPSSEKDTGCRRPGWRRGWLREWGNYSGNREGL